MTFKDKGTFARHHLLSLASWARSNPDYAILMYDDRDLQDYLTAYLQVGAGEAPCALPRSKLHPSNGSKRRRRLHHAARVGAYAYHGRHQTVATPLTVMTLRVPQNVDC
jgi:hypothetical protein